MKILFNEATIFCSFGLFLNFYVEQWLNSLKTCLALLCVVKYLRKFGCQLFFGIVGAGHIPSHNKILLPPYSFLFYFCLVILDEDDINHIGVYISHFELIPILFHPRLLSAVLLLYELACDVPTPV